MNWIQYRGGKPNIRFWTLDPIDGTKGFLRKEQYTIAFALIENYQVKIAAIDTPDPKSGLINSLDGDYVIAKEVHGGGAWIASLNKVNDEPAWLRMQVSDVNDVCTARVL